MAKSRTSRSQARSDEAIEFAREQRAERNEFAEAVWHMLRNRKCHGLKFRREHPLLPYIVDFCCLSAKLIIEVDGKSHFTEAGKVYDARRDRFLQQLGFRVLRIPGYDVIRDGPQVRDHIWAFAGEGGTDE